MQSVQPVRFGKLVFDPATAGICPDLKRAVEASNSPLQQAAITNLDYAGIDILVKFDKNQQAESAIAQLALSPDLNYDDEYKTELEPVFAPQFTSEVSLADTNPNKYRKAATALLLKVVARAVDAITQK